MDPIFRTDRVSANLSTPVEGPAGALLVEGFAARPGIYVYMNADGTTRRELVPRDALWSADSILTLGRAPLTLDHPGDLVTEDNVGSLSVGDVSGEIIEGPGGFVRVKLAVRTREAKDALQSGKVELSPGYLVTLDETAGTDPEFGDYDAVQTGRDYNHLAIVDRARGGTQMRVAMDSAQMIDPITFEDNSMDEEIEEEVNEGAEEEEEAKDSEEEEEEEEEEAAKADSIPQWATSLIEDVAAIKTALQPKKNDSRIDTDRIAWYNDRVGLQARLDALSGDVADDATNLDMAKAILKELDIASIPDAAAIQTALKVPTNLSFAADAGEDTGFSSAKSPYGQG